MYIIIRLYVTGFGKTIPNRTFGFSRNTDLKYFNHCGSLMLYCSHTRLTVEVTTVDS